EDVTNCPAKVTTSVIALITTVCPIPSGIASMTVANVGSSVQSNVYNSGTGNATQTQSSGQSVSGGTGATAASPANAQSTAASVSPASSSPTVSTVSKSDATAIKFTATLGIVGMLALLLL